MSPEQMIPQIQPAPQVIANGSTPSTHRQTRSVTHQGPGASAGRYHCREHILGRRILLQRTAVAGFRHHAAPMIWPALRRQTLLTLAREPDNPHDPNAVALLWRGQKLGYLPRGENLVVARLLDRQRQLSARIEGLLERGEHNRRISLAILMH